MPLIIDIKSIEDVKQELQQNDPDDIREWWEYKCKDCGHHVASDIHYSYSLYCIKCGGKVEDS